jgi:hypothetical protein
VLLHVELEQDHVAVSDEVLLAFLPDVPLSRSAV